MKVGRLILVGMIAAGLAGCGSDTLGKDESVSDMLSEAAKNAPPDEPWKPKGAAVNASEQPPPGAANIPINEKPTGGTSGS